MGSDMYQLWARSLRLTLEIFFVLDTFSWISFVCGKQPVSISNGSRVDEDGLINELIIYKKVPVTALRTLEGSHYIRMRMFISMSLRIILHAG